MKEEKTAFLSTTELRKLERSIDTAEDTTSGELVLMIVPESYDYPQAVFLGSLSSAFLVSVLINVFLSFRTLWSGPTVEQLWIFPGSFAFFFVFFFFLIGKIPRLKRMFILREDLEQEVEEAALTGFFRNGLDRTEQQNGLLIFVSVLERSVRILADRGISDRISQETWDGIVRHMTEEIRSGNRLAALEYGIGECAAVLSRLYPSAGDDRNELPGIITDNE